MAHDRASPTVVRRMITTAEITGFVLLNALLWVSYGRRRLHLRAQGAVTRWDNDFAHGRTRPGLDGGCDGDVPLPVDELSHLLALTRDADSVELKLTVPDSERQSAVAALDMDPLEAQIRLVALFDTPGLDLNRHGLIARARRIQGKPDDSVVKLRPVVPHDLPDELRRSPGCVVEVDAMPGGHVCSASVKASHDRPLVQDVLRGRQPVRKLFSKPQRAFLAVHGPDDVDMGDLVVLGPITVFKLRFRPAGFDRRLVAELWQYPDGTRLLELSTRCAPAEAFQVAAEARVFLAGRGLTIDGEQQTKTRIALERRAGALS
jgi:hypothetical protein